MGLTPLRPVTSPAEAVRILKSLAGSGRVLQRVKQLERVASFVRVRSGPKEAVRVRALMQPSGEIDPAAVESLIQTPPFHGEVFARQTGLGRCPFPLFESQGIRFFQSPSAKAPISASASLGASRKDYGHFLFLTNEFRFSDFYPVVRGIGGTLVGIGSLQSLDLAVAAQASCLIFIDVDPLIALTLMLVLPMVREIPSRRSFLKRFKELMNPLVHAETFLDPIPGDYRTAFGDHLEILREVWRSPQEQHFLNLFRLSWGASSLFGSDSMYAAAHALIKRRGAAVVYGDFFDFETLDLVLGALSTCRGPIRTLYVSNVLQYMKWTRKKNPIVPLLQLLFSPWADPKGLFLWTSETDDSMLYQSLKIKHAGQRLLRDSEGIL